MLIIPDIFYALLQEAIGPDDGEIKLTVQLAGELRGLLEDEDHTYLYLTQGSRYEIVKAYRPSLGSSYVPVERAQFDTLGYAFPEGSCVDVRLTASVVNELIAQQIPSCIPDCETTRPPLPTVTPTTDAPTAPPAFVGPDIPHFTDGVYGSLTAGVPMTPYDVWMSFSNAVSYELVGTYPAGIAVSPGGMLYGTPTEAGAWVTCQVKGVNSLGEGLSNTFTIEVSSV